MIRIKVTLLCRYSPHRTYVGSQIYNWELIKRLAELPAVEVHVITSGRENCESIENNVHLHTIKVGLLAHFSPLMLLKLRRKIDEIQPDVLHALGGYPYSTMLAFVRKRYPAILTIYGISAFERKYYREEDRQLRTSIIGLINTINQRMVIEKVPNIVVDTASIKEILQEWTESRIYCVPAGVNIDTTQRVLPATNQGGIDIFFVNNLVKLKGCDILIRSLARVKREIPGVTLYIGGSGPNGAELKGLVRDLGLEPNVRFLGFVSEEEKYSYYQVCKLVVVPSRWDCQPAALFDAAAAGKPVVASDMSNPGIVEDGETGFIYRAENEEELAEKLVALLTDDALRERMGASAQKNIIRYDWKNVAKTYCGIYLESISSFRQA